MARSVVRLGRSLVGDSELKCGVRRCFWDPVPRLEPVERCCCTCEDMVWRSCGAWELRWNLQGLRAQIDRKLYKRNMQSLLATYPNLEIRAASVKDVVLSDPEEPGLATGRRITGLRIGTSLLGSHHVLH